MISRRTPQVYEVYASGGPAGGRSAFRLFCRGTHYRYSPTVKCLHVGAYSIRQAFHLAGRRMWNYPLGILECAARGAPWTRYDGTTSHRPRFRPGDSLPRVERQAVAS